MDRRLNPNVETAMNATLAITACADALKLSIINKVVLSGNIENEKLIQEGLLTGIKMLSELANESLDNLTP